MADRTNRMRADQFRHNLRALILQSGLSQRESAQRIGIEYKALRRLIEEGLVRIDSRNEARLQAVCKFYGIEKISHLWSPRLETDRDLRTSETQDLLVMHYCRLLKLAYWQAPDNKYILKALDAIDRAFNTVVLGEPASSRTNARGGSDLSCIPQKAEEEEVT
jgi:transcriptional regulator with XRE-family HTH domain